jgi:hypothetical protein
MSLIKSPYRALFLPAALVMATMGACAIGRSSIQTDQAKQPELGKPGSVGFPTSCDAIEANHSRLLRDRLAVPRRRRSH